MSLSAWVRAAVIGSVLAAVAVAPGCSVDEAPGGVKKATKTGGPMVVFDLGHRPLPEIPLPNDIATWPDPSSRTGRRINASLVAPTSIERNARERFSRLEGWGTFSAISIPFNKALDADDIKTRHAADDFKFDDDVIYVVNLKTGVPVPLDLGGGNFPLTLRELSRYWPNDPRKGEANLLFETVEEDKNGNGILDDGEDTDFDGVLDHPNFPGRQRPANGVDGLYTFYDAESRALIARPMLPLDEMTEYAVVITDRLHGVEKDQNGVMKPVESPFEYIHHPAQRAAVARAAEWMSKKPEYYGYQGNVLDHVQFAFTFTTQPTVSDMFALRDGAYGKGKFGWIGRDFKPEIKLIKAVGDVASADPDPAGWETRRESCTEQGSKTRNVAKLTPALKSTLGDLASQVFGLEGPAAKRLVQGYDNVAYLAAGTVEVPWLLGDIDDVSPEAYIKMNHETGEIPHSRTKVSFFLVVPKATEKFKPPFPVAFYGHGYTGAMAEGLGFAAELARHGVATIALNAPGHGVELDKGLRDLAGAFFNGACLKPFSEAFGNMKDDTPGLDRVRDLNGDGEFKNESGRDYWTAYLFHTRDVVRQAALEEVMVTRVLRQFDGKTMYDFGGGTPQLAGDFDGDGVVDIGGPNGKFYAWGGSLGGILSSLAGAVDPYISATAPMAGGGALTDVGIRSFQGGVVEAVDLRIMGPLVISVPAESRFDCAKNAEGKCKTDPMTGQPIIAPKNEQTKTACDAGQMSIRWVAVDLNDDKEFEIACASREDFADGNDVIIGNMTNGEVRCAQIGVGRTTAGTPISDSGKPEFRVAIPATVGDQITITAYKPPAGRKQAVKQYGKSCELLPGATQVKVIDKWAGIGTNCQKAAGDKCMTYQTQEYPIGSRLVAISEGFGLKRQTPDFRRFMQLAQIALDPADPVTFAPYYYTRPRIDENGGTVAPAGIYTINTVGDMNVPVNTGISAARIHGAIPFLKADNVAAKDYPDYVAPDKLVELFGKTPNRVLLDNHVIEGIRWLKRHPAPSDCKQNVITTIDGCPSSDAYDPRVCEEALFDPDNLSDGLMPTKPQVPAKPLRLIRLAKAATGADQAAIWAPRLQAETGGFVPSGPLGGVVIAFIVPEGVHGFDPPDPCKKFDTGMYLVNMVGRFFGTGATDVPYVTNPTGHTCAAVTDWKAPEACVWK
jgi:hypothetical protein